MFKKWLVVGLASVLLLSACKAEEASTDKGQKDEEVSVPVDEEVVKEEENSIVYPLSGVGAESESTSRAIAVMVNNDPKARPQSGLHKADIVYEVLAEGNVTRFMAIFQSEVADTIGPVRSARDYYIELANGYDAFYVAHGYSAEAEQMLKSGVIDNINGMQYDGTLFQRASFRVAPHNSYISTENILKGASQLQYEMNTPPAALPFYTEEEVEKIAGDTATQVTVRYYNSNLFKVDYRYDAATGKYARYSNDEATVDLETNTPITLDNVFVVEMKHTPHPDGVHREIDLTSGGRGVLLQKGKKIDVEWKNVDGRILPFANGQEVKFVPGKTWINIIPTDPGLDSSVTIQS